MKKVKEVLRSIKESDYDFKHDFILCFNVVFLYNIFIGGMKYPLWVVVIDFVILNIIYFICALFGINIYKKKNTDIHLDDTEIK